MNFQKIFDGLPHVRTIWVNENGDYFLVPRSNCRMVNRDDAVETLNVDSEVQKEAVVETISKKKKKNK
jgi:hypothetical protein